MMNKNNPLKQRIDDLVKLCSLAAACLDIAESRQYTNIINNTRLRSDLSLLKAQGREAVFELMLCSSHRAFMRFLREYGEC